MEAMTRVSNKKKRASLNPNLIDFWFKDSVPSQENYMNPRVRVLYGGRASSKSWEYAGMAASIASQMKTRFLCVRRFQNKIKESVHTLIANQIDNFELPGFDVRTSDIHHENGSEFVFYGIERNVDEVKSFEGANILWIEEAHNLTKEQWDILEPTIRLEGSTVWISFNPYLISDFVYQRFVVNARPEWIVRKINYNENPFLSKTMLDSIQTRKEEDYDSFSHIYLGNPKSDDENVIIKRTWIEAAINADKFLEMDFRGDNSTGYDVADSGDDLNAVVNISGSLVYDIDQWKGGIDELYESSIRAWKFANGGDLYYDSIGNGAGVGSNLKREGIKGGYYKFNAGGKVINPTKEYSPGIKNNEKFHNIKAQAWQSLADRFLNTYNAVYKGMTYKTEDMISISSDIAYLNELKEELSSPRSSISGLGKDIVESKESMAKRGIKSPNLADAFIMAAFGNPTKSSVGVMIPKRHRR